MISLDGLPADYPFPHPDNIASNRGGLIAIGGDLSTSRLIQAYKQGIFPWFSQGDPILWWSPDPRTVLLPGEIHISRSLRRSIKKSACTLTIDTAFNQVTAACAAPRAKEKDTWLLPVNARGLPSITRSRVCPFI